MRHDQAIRSVLRRQHGFAAVAGLMAALGAAGWMTGTSDAVAGAAFACGAAALALLIPGWGRLRKRCLAFADIERQLAAITQTDSLLSPSHKSNDVARLHRQRAVGLGFEAASPSAAATSAAEGPLLQPVAAIDAGSRGWNALLDERSRCQALQALEESIARRLGGGGGSAGGDVLDSLGEGIAVTDLDGRLTVLNGTLSALIGDAAAPGLPGRRIDELLSAVAGEDAAVELEQLAGSVRPLSLDIPRSSDGTQHMIRFSRRPHRDRRQEVVGHVWTVRDVTQQHLAEQMRDSFVSTASHELRTPLANIRAYAETLAIADGIDVERQKEFCNTILAEATRLGRFVDELLDVTRLQAGSLTLEPRATDLERLLQDVCGKMNGQIQQKQIDFRTEIPAKLPELVADKDKLSAALVNLLGNAVKYTPSGGQVTFRVECDSRRVSFVVEDTGFGIAPDELNRIFDKFFRSDDERVRTIVGSGLGLAFVKEVARLHGGDVKVHSELDKGSRFTLTVPLDREAA